MGARIQVKVFTTGGTIDKVYFDGESQYEVGGSVVGRLLQEAGVTVDYEVIELLRKDSLDLTDGDRALIRDAVVGTTCRRLVITHGTDTMVETAKALADVTGKVIVLTGAFAPARFVGSDASFNTGAAFAAVQVLQPGVYIAMNGYVFNGTSVYKDRSKMRFVLG